MTAAQRGNWWFHPMGAGTMATRGLRSLLEGAHLEAPEMFVREVTQNSVDAHRVDATDPVRMTFSSRILTRSQALALGDFLCGDGAIPARIDELRGRDGLPEDGGAFRHLPSGDRVRVLTVEDFSTRGLGGTIGGDGPDDHFSRLVYFFGQPNADEDAGGAFGFGKSVYSVASAIRTVLYYSKPADGRDSRLIAVSLLPGHQHDGRAFTGYALCGRSNGASDFPILPLEGTTADAVAASIGLTRRDADTPGTSLMVVDCEDPAEELRSALEKWWWPRIVTTGADGLVARFTRDGADLPPPNPAIREDLAPFVHAYRHHLDGAPATPEMKTEPVRSVGKRVIGKLTLKRIESSPVAADEELGWHECRVAMMRGPKLVVKYAAMGTVAKTPFVGVFVAEPAMNQILRRAENPAHDTWAPESTRLARSGHEPTYVQAVERRCKSLAQAFQNGFEARPLPSTSRLHVLQDLLGRVLAKGNTPGPVPTAPRRPVSIEIREHRDLATSMDEAIVTISNRDGAADIPVRLTVTAHVLGDSKRSLLEALEVELFDQGGHSVGRGTAPETTFDVPVSGKVNYVARTATNVTSPVKFSVTVVGRKT